MKEANFDMKGFYKIRGDELLALLTIIGNVDEESEMTGIRIMKNIADRGEIE